ncbi:MAG: FUSC family protein [Candidatus Dormiibacterota bacterium]
MSGIGAPVASWRRVVIMPEVPWSPQAGLRAVRAAVVIPALLALTTQVIANEQIALFAAFGGFATLVLPNFGGGRQDKALAHIALALGGSALIVVGTLLSTSLAAVAPLTVLVAFIVLFAGMAGPNGASGTNGAMLVYVLAAASPGDPATIPLRLAGWWLASVCGAIAVLVTAGPPPASRLRRAVAVLSSRLAAELDRGLGSSDGGSARAASTVAAAELSATYTAAPYRPTGLAVPDQAAGSLVQGLEWEARLVEDALASGPALNAWSSADRELLRQSAGVLGAVAELTRGQNSLPDLDGLERQRLAAREAASRPSEEAAAPQVSQHLSWHAAMIALAARTIGADALVATRRADPATIARQRHAWAGDARPAAPTDRWWRQRLTSAARRHANFRSVWTLSSARGALAIAAAVTVADVLNVQHGFWVVLGTISVLRSTALGTGATALRVLAGTLIGFVLGAGLIVAIGANTTALWLCLPVAVLVAAYTPGVVSFIAGQAAFTVLLYILVNILVPIGWKVGVVRVEDVALGCAVSLIVGVLFWPRGASAVLVRDLGEAYRAGAKYLRQSAAFALGRHDHPSDTGRVSLDAALRLDEALRGYLAEQGSKRMAKEDVWTLVGAATRLRLTAQALSGLHANLDSPTEAVSGLARSAEVIAEWYQQLADRLTTSRRGATAPVGQSLVKLTAMELESADPGASYCLISVAQHLRHLTLDESRLRAAADHVRSRQSRAWWH